MREDANDGRSTHQFRTPKYEDGRPVCSGRYEFPSKTGMNFLLNLWRIPTFGWIGAAWSSVASGGLFGYTKYTFATFCPETDAEKNNTESGAYGAMSA
jgi:hypothetical protein